MGYSDLVGRFKNFPDGVKWLIAFVTAVIGFVVLFRQHVKLVLAVLALLGLVSLLLLCIYLLAAREKSVLGGKDIYKYQSHRRWAIAGTTLSILIGVAALTYKPARIFFLEAFSGRVLVKADVLIVGFDTQHASRTLELPRRLREDLESRLRKRGLSDVTVKVISTPVADDAEAKRLAKEADAKAVIYGWYDDLGIHIQIFLATPNQGAETASLKEVPWDLKDSNQKLSIVMKDVLGNVTFLSMFVIGHLSYLDNRYNEGHAAFDEAMNSIPLNVTLENEAVVHFFSGRSMQASANQNIISVACEYAQAIRLNPLFYEAYNGLGILFSEHDKAETQLPQEVYRCLQEAGIESASAEAFFDRALELQPDSASVAYNKLAGLWRGSYYGQLSDQRVEADLKQLSERDDSIPGLQLILGVIAFDKGDLKAAEARFSKVLELAPQLAGVRTNLGQVYVRKGDLEKADSLLRRALKEDGEDIEARFALANLSTQEGDLDSALKYLQEIPAAQPDQPHQLIDSLQKVLLSRVHFRLRKFQQAMTLLKSSEQLLYDEMEGVNYTPIGADVVHYLLTLLYARVGDTRAAAAHWVYDFRGSDTLLAGRNYSRRAGDTLDAAWFDLLASCEPQGKNAAPATWGEKNPCLPHNLEQRIEAVYQKIQENAAFRIYHQKVVFADMACPYVFTYDEKKQAWELDTTILYKLSGRAAEGEQWRSLKRFDGRLLIRELEAETSYIDRIRVVVVDGSGRSIELSPESSLLQERDGRYLILQPQDQILLRFLGFEDVVAPGKIGVVADGYYIPLKQ